MVNLRRICELWLAKFQAGKFKYGPSEREVKGLEKYILFSDNYDVFFIVLTFDNRLTPANLLNLLTFQIDKLIQSQYQSLLV